MNIPLQGYLLDVPLSWSIPGGVLLFILFGFYGSPLWLWSVFILGGAHLLNSPVWVTGVLFVLLLTVNIPFVRRQLYSRSLLKMMNLLGVAPKMSDTEQTAIEAGDIGLEAEIFSGRPDFNKLRNAPMAQLTDEEKAFLDGPVEELCETVDDWELWKTRQYPEEAWDLIKEHRFFGLIIPEEYDGKEFTPAINSAIVQKVASRSNALAVTVMVPNSLGPAELLIHYGTEEQKDHYLPRLARAEEIPSFALTEPKAGSDAGSMTSSGEVFKDDDGDVKIRLNWEKRWITLAPIATLIGLAFKLEDPNNHLGQGEKPGITCALVPADKDGVDTSNFHDPLGVPFYNGPTRGDDVIIDADQIIGGPERAGDGWQMLMESLSVGRGISLPATSAGAAKLTSRVASSQGVVRRQFGLPIGKFEGVEEPMSRIGGFNYIMESMRRFTCGQIKGDDKPAVISAMAKHYLTEMGRTVINDGMDIRAGSGITRGPTNMLAHSYMGTPISITVEGANILTRTMIIFGQGSIRCHPYLFDEMMGMMENDLERFDGAFWSHLGHMFQNGIRSLAMTLTRGWASLLDPSIPNTSDHRKIAWGSASFSFLADIALTSLGGGMKRKEKITGRFADAFSWLVMATAVTRRYEMEDQPAADRDFYRWAMDYSFHKVQNAFDGLYQNFPVPALGSLLKWTHGLWNRFNRIGKPPSDKLGHKVSRAMQTPGEDRRRRTRGIYDGTEGDTITKMEKAFRKSIESDEIIDDIKDAIDGGQLPKDDPYELLDEAVEDGIISEEDQATVEEAFELRTEVVQVDEFPMEEFESHTLS